jgi:hypothetical protein
MVCTLLLFTLHYYYYFTYDEQGLYIRVMMLEREAFSYQFLHYKPQLCSAVEGN